MNNTKIRDAHAKFLEFLKGKKHSTATILAYGKDIDQLASFLEELDKHHINEISQTDIEAFLGKLSEKGYTPKSLSRKLNSTRTFYRFLKTILLIILLTLVAGILLYVAIPKNNQPNTNPLDVPFCFSRLIAFSFITWSLISFISLSLISFI